MGAYTVLNHSNIKSNRFFWFAFFAKDIRIRILRWLSPRSQLQKWHLRFKYPLGAVQQWRQHPILEGRTPPPLPPPYLSPTRPNWSQTIRFKPRPLILGRQLFPTPSPYPLADVIFGWPLKEILFSFMLFLGKIVFVFERGCCRSSGPLWPFRSWTFPYAWHPFPQMRPEVCCHLEYLYFVALSAWRTCALID